MKLIRHTPSPSMIVALVALFVALGGAAYAGVTLSNNTVRSATIVNGQVKTVDLANSAVTNAKLKNNAVNSAKVKDGSLQATDLSPAAQTALKTNVAAFHADSTGGPDFLAWTGAEQVVSTVNLPAGNFVVFAKVLANNNGAAQATVGCELRLGATVIDGPRADGNIFLDVGPGDRQFIPLSGRGTLAAPGTATIACVGGTDGNFGNRRIEAIQVSSLL